jgi:hypothetical protein
VPAIAVVTPLSSLAEGDTCSTQPVRSWL